jgi:potassium channel subfamily K
MTMSASTSRNASLSDDIASAAIAPSRTTSRTSFSIAAIPTADLHQHISWPRYLASITPLICGGLGPTITLLALSGCADRWRTETVGGDFIQDGDPTWVVVVTAIAIAIGLLANVFLLMRMLGRGNPKYMQINCILLWAIECMSLGHSSYTELTLAIMNFVTVGIYVRTVGDDGPWAYAQGFWMTVCSAAMSTICAVLMSINSFMLPDFGHRGKMGLSGPQRVFVVQVMAFVFWLAVYAVCLTFVDRSGAAIFYGTCDFSFSESVYFVDVTVTTVGFGDNSQPPIPFV